MLAKALGYPRPPEHFPVLKLPKPRSEQAVIERALILHIIINCAFEMPIQLARAWLDRERLTDGHTAGEQRYLDAVEGGLAPDSQGHRLQLEALWALAWALSQVPALDFGSHCGGELASLTAHRGTHSHLSAHRKIDVARRRSERERHRVSEDGHGG